MAGRSRKGHSGWLLAPLLGVALLIALVAFLFAGLASIPGEQGAGCGAGSAAYEPSDDALADVPPEILALYVEAGNEYGVDWTVLAAIGSIESDHGRLRAAGVRSGENSAGAGGPMQFLAGTWAQYGTDGDGDGDRDRYDPADAIPAAAAYLRASGAPDDYASAIFAYNRAGWYVADVQERAASYRGQAAEGLLAGSCGQALALSQASAQEVLRNPRIDIYPGGRADLAAGRISAQITGLLASLAQTHTLTVTSLKSGHGTYTSSGRVSNHAGGRAVDIGAVDGVSCTRVSRSAPCGQLAREVAAITGGEAFSEVIFCFDPGPGHNSFAAPDHCDHVHIGHR